MILLLSDFRLLKSNIAFQIAKLLQLNYILNYILSNLLNCLGILCSSVTNRKMQ